MDGAVSVSCAEAEDGTPCGPDTLCVGGACIQAGCGDGFVDSAAGEQCEDGNGTAFDGCEPDSCTFTCSADEVCADESPCNGAETCSSTTHVCVPGTALADGNACTTREVPDGVCRGAGSSAQCAARGCGNGVVDGTEDCDDMNAVSGDGCENDCRYTCTSDEDCVAIDANVCDVPDRCEVADHRCVPTTPLECDDALSCTDDTCDAASGCVHTDNGTGQFWYADCDRDGYAAGELGSMQSCVTPSGPPAVCGAGGGWTSQRPITGQIDCLDANANVHPGATAYQPSAIAGVPAGVDFDYNCDAVEEPLGASSSCPAGEFRYDTRVDSGWNTGLCGTAWSSYKWTCPTPSVPGHWERFRASEDARVPCR
jgi:cysteine-rich repeat protein